jgi:hypothetical protein
MVPIHRAKPVELRNGHLDLRCRSGRAACQNPRLTPVPGWSSSVACQIWRSVTSSRALSEPPAPGARLCPVMTATQAWSRCHRTWPTRCYL